MYVAKPVEFLLFTVHVILVKAITFHLKPNVISLYSFVPRLTHANVLVCADKPGNEAIPQVNSSPVCYTLKVLYVNLQRQQRLCIVFTVADRSSLG